jgi:hypothetical protein
VHGHGVDPEQLQGPLHPLLGLGQLALPEQRPTQGQMDNPRQWLGGEPLDLGGLCRPSGEHGAGLVVVLVAGHQRQQRQRVDHGIGLVDW